MESPQPHFVLIKIGPRVWIHSFVDESSKNRHTIASLIQILSQRTCSERERTIPLQDKCFTVPLPCTDLYLLQSATSSLLTFRLLHVVAKVVFLLTDHFDPPQPIVITQPNNQPPTNQRQKSVKTKPKPLQLFGFLFFVCVC